MDWFEILDRSIRTKSKTEIYEETSSSIKGRILEQNLNFIGDTISVDFDINFKKMLLDEGSDNKIDFFCFYDDQKTFELIIDVHYCKDFINITVRSFRMDGSNVELEIREAFKKWGSTFRDIKNLVETDVLTREDLRLPILLHQNYVQWDKELVEIEQKSSS
jgi:hypothetical protein